MSDVERRRGHVTVNSLANAVKKATVPATSGERSFRLTQLLPRRWSNKITATGIIPCRIRESTWNTSRSNKNNSRLV